MPSPFAGSSATYPATYLIPSDGDDRDAASVNVALEALGDRTEFLRARQNDYFHYTNSTSSGGDPTLIETFAFNTIANAWTVSTAVKVDVPSCIAFDQLLCRLHIGVFNFYNMGAAIGGASFRIYYIDDFGGTPTQGVVLGSHGGVKVGVIGDDDFWIPVATHGRHTVAFNGTCRIGLEIRLTLTGVPGFALDIYTGAHLEVKRIKF